MSEFELADDLSDLPRSTAAKQARTLLESQAAILSHAATTGSLKPTADDKKYKAQRRQLRRLLHMLGVEDPIPFSDLAQWNGHWKLHLDTWAARKGHVRELIASTIPILQTIESSDALVVPTAADAESWSDLEDRLDGLVRELERATSKDDLQDVGRRAREILIDAAKLIQNDDLVPPGAEKPKAGDAKTWLAHFTKRYASGPSQKPLRTFIDATWDLAQRVTHGDIDSVEAFGAAQATILIVRVLRRLEEQKP